MGLDMLRIQSLGIKCPICNKPDWCMVTDDGTAAICSRKSKGSVKKVDKVGWLHILGNFKPQKYEVPEKPFVDWNKWAVKFAKQLIENREAFGKLCRTININPISALRFYIGWHKNWLTIPIYSLSRTVSGIQRRQGNTKRYMKHSGMGVFVPSAFFQDPSDTLAVCEGWTDTVTALEYGYNAIGKVNAYVGNEEVIMFAKTHPSVKRVIIFADNNQDGVGLAGAEETAKLLLEAEFETKIVLTPHKDLRACKQKGMTLNEIIGD
ncbi:hypothetical protein LCGC14_1365880 [marine sediment metagenome]|uniref:Toprim domain-containing protein n=1 Tax=marine sediment metagenome TaxID=412755 RepID=A0A0F9K7C1_9ZZZZ